MLHLILCRDWKQGRDEILKRIASDVKNKKENRILMVPELISHETERRLCRTAGDTASRYAEVLSFSRLGKRVLDAAGAMECLDAGGRVVAMAAAARSLSSKLKSYASVETRPEFLTGLIDGVDEFKRCCITSEDLKKASEESEGTLAQKLEELSLLMEGYDALCSRGKRDPRDQMTWVLEQMEAGTYGQEHVFYIDGFPDFTRQHMAILDHLIRVSPEVTVALNCDNPDTHLLAFEKAGNTASQILRSARQAGVEAEILHLQDPEDSLHPVREALFQGSFRPGCAAGSLRCFRTDDSWDECLCAAGQILEYVRSGCRFRDITVVLTDLPGYLPSLKLACSRMHIPLYEAGTEDILKKSVISTVMNALDAALTGFDQKTVLRYLRSSLSPLDPDTCDKLENYAFLWGIRGNKWLSPFKSHPDGLGNPWDEASEALLCELNEARTLAIDPLSRLLQGFQKAVSLKQQVLSLYGFLKDLNLQDRLFEMAEDMDSRGDNRSAQILNQLWEILISALEQMYDVLGDTSWEPEHFVRLLRLLLSQYDVGTIPPVLDAVQCGPVTAMRCHEQKHLILLGANEGSLPGYTGSAGILTDQERVALRELGVPLTGGAMEGIQAEFAEIYGVFCGAAETIDLYASGEQPSFIFKRLSQMAGGEEPAKPRYGFALADEQEAGAWLASFRAEDLARTLHVEDSYREIRRKCSYELGRVQKEHIRSLYGDTLSLSASKIDRQAECRLSYFLQYGLKAKERKEAAVDPAEFGTYVHSVLENTARCVKTQGGFSKVTLEETLDIAHRYSEEYFEERFQDIDSERLSYLFQRNAQELDMVVKELWEELKQSLFEPAAFELGFGSHEALPPIAIPNRSMNALLRGFVDRVDAWVENGVSYYRVVDYKTGKKDFDYCDVFNGVGLQMLLYMYALRECGSSVVGENPIPAGVQYFPARAPYISSEGKLTEEEAEEARQKEWKRKGLLLKDEQVLQAMEPGEKPKRMNYTVAKDGSLKGALADRDQLKLLREYVFETLGRLVEEIASGNIDPNPYQRGSSHNACTFCPYGSVCRKDTVEGRRNYKAMDARKFWEEVEKEAGKNG